MTREELAARIFSASVYNCGASGEATLKWAFDQADAFLSYAAKQREPKPCPNEGKRLCSHRPEDHEISKQACEHDRINTTYAGPQMIEILSRECLDCGESLKIEPPKPERVARDAKEWSIYRFEDGTYRAFPVGDLLIPYASRPPTFVHKVREILPGDEK